MRFEEAEHGCLHRCLTGAVAQPLGREAGEREQPRRPVRLAERPGERFERHGTFVAIWGLCSHWRNGGFRNNWDCMAVAKRVLVVEDNELNLKLFCDLLRANGYECEGVRDGRDAVAQARAFQPDLIITDIQLPHVRGDQLIAQVRADAALKAIPVLAVTAYASRDDEERIRMAGANAYAAKPIALAAFIAQVAALIDP